MMIRVFWQKSSHRLSSEAGHVITSTNPLKPHFFQGFFFLHFLKAPRILLEAHMYIYMLITEFLPSHTTSSLIQFYSQGKYFHLSCRQKNLRLAWISGIKFYKYTPNTVWMMSVLKAKQAQVLPFTFHTAVWLPT